MKSLWATAVSITLFVGGIVGLNEGPTVTSLRGFDEPLMAIGGNKAADHDQALIAAIETYKQRKSYEDVSAITGYITANPQSPWNFSLLANLGKVYRKTGYYSKAIDAWEQAWKLGKGDKTPQVQALANQVAADLTSLLSALGRSERLAPLLQEAKGRKFYGASDAMLTSASENLWLMKNKPGDSFKCGPYALQSIARMQGDKSNEHYKTVFQSQSSPKGFSLTQVRDLSKQMQMNYQMAKRSAGADLIVPSVAHWKSGHYAALLKKEGNFYLTKDPTFGQQTLVSGNALEDETDGYFLVPSGPLPAGWTSVSDTEGNSVWGRGVVEFRISDATTPCDKKNSCSCGCNHGMAGYSILLMLDSLSISDSPVGYTPPVGPDLHFTITYNQYEASQPSNQNYGNFGPCWNCSWLSYINIPTTTGGSASVNRAGGGRESYDASSWTPATSGPYAGKYGPSLLSQSTLWVTNSGNYERHLPDGSMEVFGEIDSGVRAFVTSIVDPQGNTITLNYMTDGSYRLQSVTDALGLTTTLTYGLAPVTLDLSNPLTYLVTQITDPYGRYATFTYTTSSTPELASITDVIGITSSFTYSSGSVISQMTTPYGNTNFSSSSGSFNALGTPLVRSLTVTEPDGSEVCAESRLDGSNYPTSLDNWPTVVEPYPTVFGFGDYDAAYVSYRNTYYWDKKAMQVLVNNPESDYTQSHIYHFLHANDGVSESRVLESEKPALENRIYYAYPNQTILPQPAIVEGSNADPAEVIRFDGSGNLQVRQFQHNNVANPAVVTADIDPLGRRTNYTYDTATGIDLLSVTQNTASGADTLKTMTYNNSLNPPHCPASVTDAAGQTTNYTYNGRGQVLTITPPLRAGHGAETTTYSYTGNYLTSITGPLSGATTTITHDTWGGQTLNRVKTRADAESYTLTYSYDNLDRVTQILYPDGTTETSTYLNPATSAVDLDLHASTDRLNRSTTRTYDSTRHLTSVTDPKGQTTQYGWCSCGNMTSLIDPKGNVTYFNYDVESRLTSKVYPGETQPPAIPDYTYDVLGRIATFKDKRGNVATPTYNLDNTQSGISYSLVPGTVAPPTMSYSYDPYYQPVTSAGGVSISYVPAGFLGAESPQTVTNTLTGGSAALNYSYDEWGRVVGRNIDGANNETMVFDSLGRVTNVLNLLASTTPGFAYSYFDPTHPTGRLGSVSYPNGQGTTFNYFGNTGDERLQEIKNFTPAATVLSQNDYTYDAMGKIRTRQEQTDSNTPLLWTYGYDAADQLTGAVQTNTAISSPAVRSDSYGYDAAGNPTTFNVSGVSRSPSYNALNQLTGSTPSGNRIMGFTGLLNGPASVTVNGTAAMVNSGHYFSGTASLTPGSTSTVTVVATDTSGNSRTNLYQTTVPAELTYSPTFDADGNELSNGAGQTFSWDPLNELASISYTGGASTVFTYDAMGRRINIVEKNSSGAITSTKQLVWDGRAIAEERNAGNTVTKRFFAQGEQQFGTNYYYTRDHLGSVREMVDGSGSIQARYSYDPYGRTSLVSGLNLATFQYTGDYYHPASGLNLVLYRVYDSNTGRWLSRDPIGEAASTDLYEFVRNSPENFWDALGDKPAPDRPVDPKKNVNSYNCAGLAFRNYTFLSKPEVLAKLGKCKPGQKGKPCTEKGYCLKCIFYDITGINVPTTSGMEVGIMDDFHIVCGLGDGSNSVSKSGSGPISSPGPIDSFSPVPSGRLPGATYTYKESYFCCPSQ